MLKFVSRRYGEIHDPALSGFNFSWNGALATLQVAHQFYTWTRPVSNHTAGGPSFSYPKDLPGLAEWSVPSPYQNWAKNQYFLSGKLEALDFPGEWFLDASNTLYFRPVTPTHLGLSQGECPPPPTDGSIEVKIRDYVVTTPQPTNTGPGNCAGNNVTVGLSGLTLLGGTLELWCCAGCTVSNVTLSYPTFNREIPEMDAIPGKTAKTTVAGWNNVIVDSTLTMSNNHGLAVSGSNNAVLNTLIDRTDWLGTLEYIPLAVDGGNGNRVINSTVRYFGNAGVVTSIANTPPAAQNGTQNPPMPMAGRNLEVAYCHIHHGGLIGKDSAALYTGGWSSAGLHWHHNWVHDATEKCIRGDDQSRNMTVHHNVIFNCGRAPVNDSQSEVAGFGLVLKGNGHSVYGNTIFSAATAELCLPSCVERLKPFRPQYPRQTQNGQTTILNSIASVKSAKCGCNATSPVGGTFKGMYAGELASLKLANSDGYDFRPLPNSPLIGAGVQAPGDPKIHPDIGAYQHDAPRWVAGCRGRPECPDL